MPSSDHLDHPDSFMYGAGATDKMSFKAFVGRFLGASITQEIFHMTYDSRSTQLQHLWIIGIRACSFALSECF